jgi:dTDP-4-amino-4,6-dideoxygalactose transaminase
VAERDRFRDHLQARGIDTAIHYPVPVHLQPAYRALGYGRGAFPVSERAADSVVSLPMHPFLTREEVEYVAATSRAFFGGAAERSAR